MAVDTASTDIIVCPLETAPKVRRQLEEGTQTQIIVNWVEYEAKKGLQRQCSLVKIILLICDPVKRQMSI